MEVGSRGRRSRRGSEGKDGRLEVLDSMGICTRVVNRVGKDSQNLRPLAGSKLIKKRTRSWGRGGRWRDGGGRGMERGGRRKGTGGGG